MNLIAIHPEELYILPRTRHYLEEPRDEVISRFVSEFLCGIVRRTIQSKIDVSTNEAYQFIYRFRLRFKHRVIQLDIVLNTNLKPLRIVINQKAFALDKICSGVLSAWLFSRLESSSYYRFELSGREIEVFLNCGEEPYDNVHWNTNYHSSDYLTRIYPALLDYCLILLRNQDHVLDVCGGDGILGSFILGSSVALASYTLLERNEQQLQIAHNRLGIHDCFKPLLCDLTTTDLREHILQPLDLVIGSGALTRCVLAQDVALKVFDQIATLLKPGGYLLLTGLEYSWIDSERLRTAGFRVFNTFNTVGMVHLFVAQKKRHNDIH